MVIQTRFDRDQMVWFRRGSQMCDGIVFSINVDVRYEGVCVDLYFDFYQIAGIKKLKRYEYEQRRSSK